MPITLVLKGIYMLQLLPQSEVVSPNTTNPTEAVEFINSYINEHHCEHMDIDISFMNILDSCYVSTLCSANHFIKYPNGKINWKISSELVREFNRDLELGNCEYLI